MDPSLFPEGVCRLILIGKTGNGKSATGNSTVGHVAFRPQAGINSVTKRGNLGTRMWDSIKIQVLDTPGLDDTEESNEAIMRRITRSLLVISPGPHAILLCLSCDTRFTHEELKVLETFKHSFGEAMMSYLIVVMVKKDVLERNGQKFEEQLEQCKPLKKLITDVDNRYVLFDNSPEASPTVKEEQVQSLLQKVMEVVRQNKSYFQHKMSRELVASLIVLKEAELRRMNQENTSVIEEDLRPRNQAPNMPRASTEEDLPPTSFLRLKDSRIVTRNRMKFERASYPDPASDEEGNAARPNPTLNISHCRSDSDLTAAEGGLQDRFGNKADDGAIADKFTFIAVKPKGPKRRPPQHSPLAPPDGKTHAEDDKSPQEQDSKPPQKPPRLTQQEAAEDRETRNTREYFQRLGMQPQAPAGHLAEQKSIPKTPFVYEVPDRPGMTMEDKKALVDRVLNKLARGENLTDEQKEEVERASRSVMTKIQEGMRKFSVKTIEKCSVM